MLFKYFLHTNGKMKTSKNSDKNGLRLLYSFNHRPLYLVFLFCATFLINTIQARIQKPSTYRLLGTSNSYAQYMPWYPCLNGTIAFEFKTSESNGMLLYAQSLPYKYIQLALVDGSIRMRMRIGEKDNPRGVFLINPNLKLNDDQWHQIQIIRINERTILSVDGQNLYHIHKDANLDGYDLYFGDYSINHNKNNVLNENINTLNNQIDLNSNGNNNFNNLLFIGGLPNNLQTYDLSLGTALFEQKYNGLIRNVRAFNCSFTYLSRINVLASNGLKYVNEHDDPCLSDPCLNHGLCLVEIDSSSNGFKCDCSYTNYEGVFCEKCK